MTTPEQALLDRREALRRVALLLGGALSAPAMAGVLAGVTACERSGRVPGASWIPRVLSPLQGETVAVVAEHIIPETDTPGARGVGVHEFIDTMLAEYHGEAERVQFAAGLADLDRRAHDAHGVDFLDASSDQQRLLLAALDRESHGSAAAPPFFRMMKELTLLGYYTSEAGATRELRYEQVPGRFDACIPFADVGRAWAT